MTASDQVDKPGKAVQSVGVDTINTAIGEGLRQVRRLGFCETLPAQNVTQRLNAEHRTDQNILSLVGRHRLLAFIELLENRLVTISTHGHRHQ